MLKRLPYLPGQCNLMYTRTCTRAFVCTFEEYCMLTFHFAFVYDSLATLMFSHHFLYLLCSQTSPGESSARKETLKFHKWVTEYREGITTASPWLQPYASPTEGRPTAENCPIWVWGPSQAAATHSSELQPHRVSVETNRLEQDSSTPLTTLFSERICSQSPSQACRASYWKVFHLPSWLLRGCIFWHPTAAVFACWFQIRLNLFNNIFWPKIYAPEGWGGFLLSGNRKITQRVSQKHGILINWIPHYYISKRGFYSYTIRGFYQGSLNAI